MEYYAAIRRRQILIHETTWMNYENIMISEERHKRIYIVFVHLYKIPRTGTFQLQSLASVSSYYH